jgi:hypothetical protein
MGVVETPQSKESFRRAQKFSPPRLLVHPRVLVRMGCRRNAMTERRIKSLGSLLLAVAFVAGCGGDDDDGAPADVSGSYTIAITNGDNPCNLQNWMKGEMNSGIPLTLTQDGLTVDAKVEGVAAGVISLLLGSADYQGHISGGALEVDNFGTVSFTSGNCAFTVKSSAKAQISGDVIMGTIDYTPVTNGSPQCAPIESCVSEQRFNGMRPPTH